MRDSVHAVDGPDPEFYRRLHALEAAVADVLRSATFRPGLDESLEFVAQDVVAVVLGGANVEDVAGSLRALAAPASSHIPPLPEFLPLARHIVDLVNSINRQTPDAV